MSKYRETLNKWAEKYVPEGSIIQRVDIDWEDAHRYSTYTAEAASLSISIAYTVPDDSYVEYRRIEPINKVELCDSLGGVLTALFAIEDNKD